MKSAFDATYKANHLKPVKVVTDMRELALPRHTCFIHPVNSFYNIPLYTEVK